jgi:hypothetical protein
VSRAVHRQVAKNAKGIFMRAQRKPTITIAESSARSARDETPGASWRLWRPGADKSAVIIALVAVLALTGCGKKPRNVDPPEGTNEVFPRVYPQDPDNPAPKKAPDPSSVLRGKI